MKSKSLRVLPLCIFTILSCFYVQAQGGLKPSAKSLAPLQQKFIDYRFGMFIHYNIPTYMDHDWADPEAPASTFAPKNVDCDQWAKAAKSANMTYGCLTTKHHSGFCIWDTKSTDYNVMNSPYKKDIVADYVKAFRDNGLKVMLYYSILDTHHKLRPHQITKKHITMVKEQITELQSINAYLYRAVYNESLNYLKHEKVKMAYQSHANHSMDKHESAEDQANVKQLEQRIQTAMNELPEQCRTIFQLSRFEELKYREIADRLGISVKTVENQMGKALKVLRTKLVEYLPVLWLLLVNLKNMMK